MEERWHSRGYCSGKGHQSGGGGSNPDFLTNFNGTLFFSASDGINGNELWKTDGTAAGTVLVKDIRPGGGGSNSNPEFLTNISGVLYFAPMMAPTASSCGRVMAQRPVRSW